MNPDRLPAHLPVPAVAALLGLLFPGAGHIYCGKRGRGALILVVSILTLFGCGLWNLWAAWSGWRLATRMRRRGEPVPRRDDDDAPSGSTDMSDGLECFCDVCGKFFD